MEINLKFENDEVILKFENNEIMDLIRHSIQNRIKEIIKTKYVIDLFENDKKWITEIIATAIKELVKNEIKNLLKAEYMDLIREMVKPLD
jgi:hypothetical protein